VASVWPLYHKVLIGGVLQRWLPFWKDLPSPQRNSVRVTIRFLVTSLTKALLPLIGQFVRATGSRKSLGGLNFSHFLGMIEASVFLGTFNAAVMFWYPSPDLCLYLI
jgi:hypothetical protein